MSVLSGMAVIATGSALLLAPATASVTRPSAAETTAGMTVGHTATATTVQSGSVIISDGAVRNGYTTKQVTISRGGQLNIVNRDSGYYHTVTSEAVDANGNRLFDAEAGPGRTVSVPGVSRLAAGTYVFFCRYHSSTMRGTLVVEGAPGGTTGTPPSFDQPLTRPPVLTDAHLRIPIERALVQVFPTGPKTAMWTYGGTYPGPTIRRPAGKATAITFVNRMPSSVGALSVHFHGDHHSSADDGQPTTHLIRPGHARTYDLPLTDHGRPEPQATDFYHDHRMDRTGRNVWRGLQGMFLIDDPQVRGLGLPSGPYDVPLMITDRSFTKDNQLTNPFKDRMPTGSMHGSTGPQSPPSDATVGTRVLVNGRVAPYLRVTTHRYRLRLVNASNFRSYNFALSDGRPFLQIGTGNAMLRAPVIRQQVLLGPAQRADVVVDFAGELGQRVVLSSVPAKGTKATAPDAAVMQFRVVRKVSDTSTVPTALIAPPALRAPKPSTTLTFGLHRATTGSYWTINGRPFDPDRVVATVPLGSTRTWVLHNSTDVTHFVHLHEEQWHTVLRDGKRPPAWERGLEDTWRLEPGETVRVAARFTDHTGTFMIHCHMLDHEDDGMMTQFRVVRPRSAASVAAARPARPSTSVGTGGAQDASAVTAVSEHGSMAHGSMADGSMALPLLSADAAASTTAATTTSWAGLGRRIVALFALQVLLLAVARRVRRRLRPA